jgi:glycosyltransferase involved in cell wall biosynthesis
VADKIVHLTSVHSPWDVRIFGKECRSLAHAGYDVTLIAPHDRDELVDGVRIRSVPRSASRAGRMLATTVRVLKAALSENADVYHFHDPELIPAGIWLKARGKRVIYDVHEDVPRQTFGRHWLPRGMRRPVAWMISVVEAVGGQVFDGIVAATPTIAARFPAKKTITLYNYPIVDSLPADPTPLADRERCIAYVGAISRDRGMLNMLEALAKVDGRLLLGGTFSPPSLLDEARRMPAWDRVNYRGTLDRTGVATLLGESRLGIVTLLPTPSYVPSLPVKLFEYMLAGLPVVASDFPLWREIVDDAECGLLVDPYDTDAIARACQWLLDHPREAQVMGRNGRSAALAKRNWQSEKEKLVGFYRGLLPRSNNGVSNLARLPDVHTEDKTHVSTQPAIRPVPAH